MENIQSIRELFPIVKNRVFLNHASQSPLPKPVSEAMKKYVDEFSNFGYSPEEFKTGKRLFAKLVGADPDEIALIANSSTGLNIIANMLDCSRGSNVVTMDLECASVVYPWLRKRLGIEVRHVKNDCGKIFLGDFERTVDNRTKVVAVSHVEYSNGFRNDLNSLAQIAHDVGATFVVDATQSAGAMQIDVKRDEVDFLVTSCHKWLLGPAGIGFLYVRKDMIEDYEPPFVGLRSVKPEAFMTETGFWDLSRLNLSNTASRFEIGKPSIVSLVGAKAALQLLLKIGVDNIQKRIFDLTDCLIESVEKLGLKIQTPKAIGCRSGIVNFLVEKPREKVKKLRESDIVVSMRALGIRVSPHFYNTEEEILSLITELKEN